MRVLVISNMLPDAAHPERGRFVRDQVAALRRLSTQSTAAGVHSPGDPHTAGTARGPGILDTLEVQLYELRPGLRSLIAAARDLRRRYRGQRFDVVHAHFGLSAWPALAVRARARGLTVHGTDVSHPRTRLATRAVLPTIDLVGAASQELIERIPGRRARARAQVLPCGVDLERFRPMSRGGARRALGLGEGPQPCLLFPADPGRAEKRHDRAQALARAVGARLLTLGGVRPERVPLYVNAAHAVIVPSEREGFGLAVLEALACDVPVLATPVGAHPQALDGVRGTLCAPFDLERWRMALGAHLETADPRVEGRARAERFSSLRMAERLAQAWRLLIAGPG